MAAIVVVAGMPYYGYDGAPVATSPDGAEWTHATLGGYVSEEIFDGCWSPELGLFVIVGSGAGTDYGHRTEGYIATSPDGTTWTSRTSTLGRIRAVVWSPGLSLFVACGVTSTGHPDQVATSPDGVTWTARTTDINGFECMAWSPELGLFVGGEFEMAYSDDGTNWATVEDWPPDHTTYGLAWSPELGLFSATGAVLVGSVYQRFTATSSDGLTWDFDDSGTISGVMVWSPELAIFVAAGTSVTHPAISVSSDGSTWADPVEVDWNVDGVTWSADLALFVAVGSTGSGGVAPIIVTSPDGTNWTTQTIADWSFPAMLSMAVVGLDGPATPAPVHVRTSARSHGPRFNRAPIGAHSSARSHGILFNRAPIGFGSTADAAQPGVLSAYEGEPHDILAPVELTGRLVADLPAPVAPVDSDGIAYPTQAPTVVSSDTDGGHLLAGTYRYAYAAYVVDMGRATAPSPWSEPITLTTDDTITITYPRIDGATGYLVYREEAIA